MRGEPSLLVGDRNSSSEHPWCSATTTTTTTTIRGRGSAYLEAGITAHVATAVAGRTSATRKHLECDPGTDPTVASLATATSCSPPKCVMTAINDL
jgi:hypothetical protein